MLPPMPVRLAPSTRTIGLAMLALVAAIVAIELARPLRTASIAYDSQVAVLHFQRLVDGQHLEAFVATTPKPFLTAVYGVLYTLFGDWRPIAWATIGAYVVGVVMAARLADRIAGPVAGTVAGVAVLVAPSLLFDVGFALATPWALALWLAAGLALTGARPRWGVAGLCLALATLARVETLVVIGVAALAVTWSSFAPLRFVPGGRAPGRAWLVPLVAALAIPVMLVHDALLTGDPLFWTTVAGRYSAATRFRVLTPLETIGFLVERYWSLGGLVLLAAIGLANTWWSGRRAVALGLIAFGPGIAAFLVLLAVRGIFVSDRYAAPIDLAVAFAAGLGFSALVEMMRPAVAGTLSWIGSRAGATLVAGSAAVAVLVAGPYWVVDPGLRPGVQRSSRLALDIDRAAPLIRAAAAATGGTAADRPWVLVPTPVRPRMAVSAALPLNQIDSTDPARVDLAAGYPAPGQIIVHSASGDPEAPGFADLETAVERTVHGVTVEPLLADADRQLWVIRIR